MNAPKTLAESFDRYVAAWAVHDPDAIADLHTDDTIFWLHHGQDPVSGREAVRDTFATMFKQLPDFGFVVHRTVFGSRHWVLDWTLTTGTARWDCLDLVTVTDDWLVAHKDTFIDGVQLARTLGE